MMRTPSTPTGGRARQYAALIAAAIVTVAILTVLGSDGATAANTTGNLSAAAPMYNNSTASVANETWLAGRMNATLVNVTALSTRVGTFVIGTGVTAQGGVGSAGAMLTGLIVLGAVGGQLVGGRVGSVAGPVLGIAAAGALVGVGIAPAWLFAVVMFGVGLILTAAIIRSVR